MKEETLGGELLDTETFPNRETALATLDWAAERNPGNWICHSRVAGDAALRIASATPGMDAEKASVCCLLHDIGRYVGVVRARHQIEGYRFCMERGWTDVARICLTHTYPLNDVRRYNEYWDVDEADKRFIETYVRNAEYTPYDYLAQLVDYLALPSGFCILEKRMVDVARRHGTDEGLVARWNRLFELKAYFDDKAGVNIYSLLPGIRENSIL